jgi:Ca-activated chloride channel family protein
MRLTRTQMVFGAMMVVMIFFIIMSIFFPDVSILFVNPACGVADRPPCPPTATPIPTTPPPLTIEIASSNTKQDWLEAVITKFNREVHTILSGEAIVVRATHGTSGGFQNQILDGDLQPIVFSPGDYSWVETTNEIWHDRTGKLLAPDTCPQTTFAPIGFAMWRPMAEALGWPDTSIGWNDLIEIAASPDGWASVGHPEWGTFKFGHTHPDYSNVGLLMMTALAYSATGTTSGLTTDAVYSDVVVDAFHSVELNTYHYGIQSRDLLELMVRRGPTYLHAITTSEAETLRTNRDFVEDLRFPLVFVFPADGTFWGEHPYCVLDADWVSDGQKEAAAIFLDYLLAPEQQALAIEYNLRPIDESIALHAPLALENGTDPRATTATVAGLEIPSADVANAIVDVFYQTKKPAALVLVLDTSGSMNGAPIVGAVESAINFVHQLDARDEIHVVGFGTTTYAIGEGGLVSQVGESLTITLGGVFADGNTALYDAVCEAVALVDLLKTEHQTNNNPHLYGIILLSDGEDTASSRSENQMFSCLPDGESVEGVKVFTIAYGDAADRALLERIANRTNGIPFIGNAEDIERIFNAILAQ